MIEIARSRRPSYLVICRALSVLSGIAAIVYLKWLLFDARPDNYILYGMLVAAELFNVAQASGYWHTIITQQWVEPPTPNFSKTMESVDIYVTVFGEPADIVERTVAAAAAIRHPRKTVYVLDDGSSPAILKIARRHRAKYLTRPTNRGAKAGNINDAMKRTDGDYILVFDADHVAAPEFLERTLGVFSDITVAFVQTPQVYWNKPINRVAAGSNDQQGVFYGAIMRGKNTTGSAFACGTNVVYQRAALEEIGGMPEDSITEDQRASLLFLERGYRSVYVPTVLARGMGPVDVGSYFNQQFRWARGSFDIMYHHKPFFRGMPFVTRFQYFLCFLYWFSGWAYVAYMVLPVAYLFFGLRPIQVPNDYPVYFLPYIVISLVTIGYSTDFKMSFAGLWFTLASFPVFIKASIVALSRRPAKFVVTSKEAGTRTFRPVRIQIAVVALLLAAIVHGIYRFGFVPATMNNVAIALGHIFIIQGFIRYSYRPEASRMNTVDIFDVEPRRNPPGIAELIEGESA